MIGKIKIAMHCLTFIENVDIFPSITMMLIQLCNIIIDITNIIWSAVLIWALRRMQQTKTISFHLILILSISDLTIGGIFCQPLLTSLSFHEYQKFCSLTLSTQAVVTACNNFSAFLVSLIALDQQIPANLKMERTFPSNSTFVRST